MTTTADLSNVSSLIRGHSNSLYARTGVGGGVGLGTGLGAGVGCTGLGAGVGAGVGGAVKRW